MKTIMCYWFFSQKQLELLKLAGFSPLKIEGKEFTEATDKPNHNFSDSVLVAQAECEINMSYFDTFKKESADTRKIIKWIKKP